MKTLIPFFKPYRVQCGLILLIVLADVGGSLLVPTITANMINSATNGGELSEIIRQGILMLVIALVSGAFTLLGSWLCATLSANLGRDLREAVYDKSLQFSASDFEVFGTASMITRTLNDINIIQQAFVFFIQMILPVPVICVLGVVLSFRINAHMGFLILSGAVLVLLAALLIMRKAAPIFGKLQRFLDRMNVVLRENLTGVRVIRAFNKEPYETGRMTKTFGDYAESSIQANYLFAGLDCLATVVINLIIVTVLYVGGNAVGAGNMEIGDITAVSEYAIWILMYIMMAQMTILMLPRAVTCMQRVADVLNHKPEITDGEKRTVCTSEDEVLAFRHVSFRFADADEETLSDIDFVCRRGQTTAIIGGTGSGKSTITKLLLRYHDVTNGTITLHGQDIRDLAQKDVRSAISYVPQKAWLFSGTIAENLRYGNPKATEEELLHALHVAQSDFVLELPERLESPVAQGGTNFSGGQKQRLSIARALAKKADLYVFDDSFSALDFKTDAALRHALAEEVKDSAVLIIAQRINTILHADQIIVFHDGKIVGKGRHEELIKTCPVYLDIANSQMKGGEQIAILLAIYLASALFYILQNFLMASFAEKLNYQLRSEIAEKFHRLPLSFYDRHQVGEVMSRVTNDLDKMSEALQTGLIRLFVAVGTVIGSIVMMLRLNLVLTLVFLGFTAVSLLITNLVSRKTLQYAAARQRAVGKMNGLVEESYSGRMVIKAFNYEEQSSEHIHAAAEELARATEKTDFMMNAVNPGIRLVNRCGIIGIAILGGKMMLGGAMSPGIFQAFFQYVNQAGEPITELSYMINSLQSALASVERVYDLLDEPEMEADPLHPTVLKQANGTVEFSHVRFGYVPEKPLMTDVNISVKPGQKIAIVGTTGAGKTTLVNLLMRFYEVNGGHILLDGVPTKEMSRNHLRSHFGMVLQDTWLFEGTIAENIAYGKPDAAMDEIKAAAKAARADFFIRTLPKGYDTVLTNDAENISIGQRQLLTIARVFLCNPAILILDEATSSVDTRTEIEIGKAMKALMYGRTSFVIAHRLSTIVDADIILLMQNGNIIEQGNHTQLLAAKGAYADLYNSQFA